MPRTADNLHKHELIGLEAEIIQSTDPSKKKVKGKVTNETKNTIQIQDKKIPKKEATFKFYLPNGQTRTIKGTKITKRPEDRIKQA